MQKPSRDGVPARQLSWTFGLKPHLESGPSHTGRKPWARCSHPTWSWGEALRPPALVFPAGASSEGFSASPCSAGTLGGLFPKGDGWGLPGSGLPEN